MEALTPWSAVLDALVGIGLLWLAWRALASPDLFKAVVLFIAFSLVMALAWVRVEAPDIALAEAAIGAGLTGALLLTALARLDPAARGEEAARSDDDAAVAAGRWRRGLAAVVPLCVAAGLGLAITSLPPLAPGLSREIAAHLDASGVSNPVTAVLLNFRAYDTLLEMLVLLLALLGAWSLRLAPLERQAPPGPVLDVLTRLVTPVLILVTAYLLWAGSHSPGGAFQAGAVLGAAGVLLLLAGWRLSALLAERPVRAVLVAGAATFVAVAAAMLPIEGRLLQYPPAQAGMLILVIESVATLSIGATLAALFLGGRPPDRGRP